MAVQLPEGEDTNEWLAVHGAFPTTCLIHSSADINDDFDCSGGLLQPSEHALRDRDRILYAPRSTPSAPPKLDPASNSSE